MVFTRKQKSPKEIDERGTRIVKDTLWRDNVRDCEGYSRYVLYSVRNILSLDSIYEGYLLFKWFYLFQRPEV
jgi:hypothetical protein